MEAELIISGLCSFINIRDEDKKVIGPSVILVQTDNCGAPDCSTMHDDSHNGAGGRMVGRGEMASNDAIDHEASKAGTANGHRSHNHIPFIAYNADEVDVNNGCGFSPVPGAPNFRFMPLDGVEMTIEGEATKIEIDESYDRCVAQKESYWPDESNEYNPAYVPKRGSRPLKSAVKAWLPLHGGKLAAGNMSRCAWAFLAGSNVTQCGLYAEEVVYKDFPHHAQRVDIKLNDLKDESLVRTLSFVPKKTNGDKVSLFLGNHVEADMASAVRREQFDVFDSTVAGTHWVFLNQIAASPGPGPLPKPLPIPFPGTVPGVGGGSGTGGPCGPGGG